MTDTPNAAALFGSIVSALDGKIARGFQPQGDNSGWGTFALPDGVWLHVCIGGYAFAGRISISGSWPSYKDVKGGTHVVTPRDVYENGHRLDSPSITVAATRPVPQIVNEINRRLLTTLGLREIWHKVKARADATTAGYNEQRALVERTAKATGGEARGEFKSISYGFEIGEAEHRGGYGDTPHHFDVTLRNVSPDELAKIIALVRESRAGQE